MKESRFIDQNKEKWRELEKQLEKDDPKKLSELFIQVSDDLSYSRTFYKNRSVRAYLNGVAQSLFHKVYKGSDGKKEKFVSFWKKDLPLVLYNTKYELLVSLIIFGLSMLIGVYSTANSPGFPEEILGNNYVEMTKENIAKGDPMAVYKSHGAFDSFLGITFNNIFVAFRTFVSGVLLGIGSIMILIYNGVMVGTFQYFFVEEGLFAESALTIWQHGTIEILSIIIAGGAGITMGKGILFPGTLTRYQSFRLSAQRGLKIMIGLVPLFIIAGFIEGFLTRFTEMPNAIRLVSILVSLTIMLFYFVWYPWSVAKSVKDPYDIDEIPAFKEVAFLNFEKAQSTGNILGASIQVFQRNFVRMFVPYLLIIIGLTGLMSMEYFNNSFRFYSFKLLTAFRQNELIALGFKCLFLFVPLYTASRSVYREKYFQKPPKHAIKKNMPILISLLLSCLLGVLIQLADADYTFWLLILFLPFVSFLNHHIAYEWKSGHSVKMCFGWIFKGFGKFFGVYFLMTFISFLLMSLAKLPAIGSFLSEFLRTILENDNPNAFAFKFASAFVELAVTGLGLCLICSSLSILYYSLKEYCTREELMSRINKIGANEKVFGLDKED